MIIREEQMTAFEDSAEQNFVQRLAEHLRQNYADAVVRLPDQEDSTLPELPDEKLHSLVEFSIEKARSYEMTFESSISAFSAVMFRAAPNFDKHSMSKLCLKDKNIEPNKRLDEVLEILTEEHWEKIREDYDPNAWEEEPESSEEEQETENPDLAKTFVPTASPEKPQIPADAEGEPDPNSTIINIAPSAPAKEPTNIDDIGFDDTLVDMKPAEGQPKEPVNLDDISFEETMVDFGKVKKSKKLPDDEDFDLDETIMNIDPGKE